MKLFVSFSLAAFFVGISFLVAQESSGGQKKPISFSSDVFPIIKKRCLPCHASDSENPSEFIMDAYPDIVKGGKHGTPIIPKNGDGSVLVQKLKPSSSFGDQMPLMTKKKLTDEEIELFKKWIDQGAKKN